MLWDLAEGKRLYSLDATDVIHALCFSPNRYWLCAATQSCIKVKTFLACLLCIRVLAAQSVCLQTLIGVNDCCPLQVQFVLATASLLGHRVYTFLQSTAIAVLC